MMMNPEISTDGDLVHELAIVEQTIHQTRVFADDKGCRVNPQLLSLAAREEHIRQELTRRGQSPDGARQPSLS